MSVISQADTVNQLNAKGKKEGFWTVYLDSLARKADSANAFFIGLECYHNGKNSFNFYDARWKRRDSVVFSGIETSKGNPKPVTGKFTWYERKNQMITFEENYEQGLPVRFKHVRYKKKGRNYTWAYIKTIDFTKRYRGMRGSYLIQEQNNQAIYNMEEWARYWYRDGRRGWKKYKIKTGKPL